MTKKPWCIVDTKDGKGKCQRCGQEEDLPLPLPVSEFAEYVQEFLEEHEDCSQWWWVYDPRVDRLTVAEFTDGNEAWIPAYEYTIRVHEDGFYPVSPIQPPYRSWPKTTVDGMYYESLLHKYIAFVGHHEGTDFIRHAFEGDGHFTTEEREHLQRISQDLQEALDG